MQPLVHYSDDSDPDPTESDTRRETTVPLVSDRSTRPATASVNPPTPVAQRGKTVTGIRINTRPTAVADADAEGENITQIPQQVDPTAGADDDVDRWETAYRASFNRLPPQQIFRLVSRPPAMTGAESWGIPPPTNALPSAALQAKVANFLKLKIEQDRHINTTLLSSTAFANPHIYSKLVEFVDIDERGSAFPGGGWGTRRGLERRIPEWGAKALGTAEQQKAEEMARVGAQAVGKRKGIDFTTGTGSSKRRDDASGRNGERRSAPLPRGNGSVESVSARLGRGGSRDERERSGSGGEALGRYGDGRERKRDKERRWD